MSAKVAPEFILHHRTERHKLEASQETVVDWQAVFGLALVLFHYHVISVGFWKDDAWRDRGAYTMYDLGD